MVQPLDDLALPLVSVVMPVYNAKRFLPEALSSIESQSYMNWELIIVDDASTDGSLAISSAFKRKHPGRVVLVRMQKTQNAGGDCAANVGVRLSRGVYIAKMDADDIAHPDRLKLQVEHLQRNPSVFLVGSQADVIDEKGNLIGEKTVPCTASEIYRGFIDFHTIIHPSIMFRNERKGQQFYRIRYPLGNDYYTFFSLICEGKKFENLPQKLLQYRIHGKNSSLCDVRIGVWYSFLIRMEVVHKYKYRISPFTIAKTLVQLLCGLLLPQKVSFYLYLLARGIVKSTDLKKTIRMICPSPLRTSGLIPANQK
jgi:glycosyltransferase involved in cell wall biosynthesis